MKLKVMNTVDVVIKCLNKEQAQAIVDYFEELEHDYMGIDSFLRSRDLKEIDDNFEIFKEKNGNFTITLKENIDE